MTPRLLAAFAILAAPAAAQAAACCLSTSAFGAGRLAAWEDAAAGLQLGLSSNGGRFANDGGFHPPGDTTELEGRATAFGIVRVLRDFEAGVRVPWVFGLREAGDLRETGSGPGDLAFSLRWDAIQPGRLPGIAFVAGASVATGRATADSEQTLGADVTGRGDTVLTLGASVEKAYEPWFVRLDAAALLPLAHDERGHEVRSGPGVEVLFGGGLQVASGLVLSLVPRLRWESDVTMDGFRLPRSSALELAVGTALAWDFSEHWTLQIAADTGLPADGLGRNRPLLSAASVGFRRGFF